MFTKIYPLITVALVACGGSSPSATSPAQNANETPAATDAHHHPHTHPDGTEHDHDHQHGEHDHDHDE